MNIGDLVIGNEHARGKYAITKDGTEWIVYGIDIYENDNDIYIGKPDEHFYIQATKCGRRSITRKDFWLHEKRQIYAVTSKAFDILKPNYYEYLFNNEAQALHALRNDNDL